MWTNYNTCITVPLVVVVVVVVVVADVGCLVLAAPVGGAVVGGADGFPATPLLTGLTGERGILLPPGARVEALLSGAAVEDWLDRGGTCLCSE